MTAKCPTCSAPVNLAPDGDPRYEAPQCLKAEVARLREALTLVERLYYMEGKEPSWRAAHMNGVASDALSPEGDFAWARRYFPRGMAAEAYAHRSARMTPTGSV